MQLLSPVTPKKQTSSPYPMHPFNFVTLELIEKFAVIDFDRIFNCSLLCSLVNVLVYSLRDKEFRDFLRGRKNSKRRSSTLATSSTETGIWPRRSIVSIMS